MRSRGKFGPEDAASSCQTIQDLIFWQYAKIILASAGFGKRQFGFVLEMLHECHSLALHEITENPRYFIEGLEDVVGSWAQVIAKSVVRQMHSRMGITT